jgi:hypothetical protein
MHTYRFYFYDDHTTRGRFDFQADDDDRAVEAAEILFEACSDRSQSWEIWDGDMLILSGPQILEKPLRAADLSTQRQQNIIECEEAILNSEWAIASSKRLLAELNKLKGSAKAVPRDPSLA